MKLARRLTLAGLLVAALLAGAAPGGTVAQEPTDAGTIKVGQILEESGYSYEKRAARVWTIPFEGKAFADFTVILSTSEDGQLLVIFVVLARKAEIQASAALWSTMLHFNDELDRVKVGIDPDQDAFVRIDLSTRIVDVAELKVNIEQLAASADEVYAALQPHLITSPPTNE